MMSILNWIQRVLYLIGPAGVVGIALLGLGIIDILTWGILTLHLLVLFDLDQYKSLLAKYRDPHREEFRCEREWAYANYKEYMHRARQEHNFQQMKNLRKAKRAGDYIWLYNLMIDWDGDEEGQILD